MEKKGTEAPFSGEYDDFFQKGIFTCRKCGAYLYRSEDKFDSHCGWPSFDDEVRGSVRRSPDEDGSRTEILCHRCGSHLGHVFSGEGFTPKNMRHCVNSLSMRFVPSKEVEKKKSAYLAGGCFWCLDTAFRMVEGVRSVVVGYAGGKKSHPSYEEVSTGKTGHAETVKISYDPTKISFEGLLSIFFTLHDPTTKDAQGPDVGNQYRSAIFYEDDLQKEIAENFVGELEKDKVFSAKITTQIIKLNKFYPAEDYHQDYYNKNRENSYCMLIINPKIELLKRKSVIR